MDEPAAKKIKLEDVVAERVLNSQNNLTPIIDPSLTREIGTVKVFTARIKEKRFISKVVTVLNKNMSVRNLQHLKRICHNSVLLKEKSDIEDDDIEKFVEDTSPECLEYFEGYCAVDVPSEPPKSRRQFDECNKLWPCNFHPDKHLERLLGGSFFVCAELKAHRFLMAVCLDVGLICKDLGLAFSDASIVFDPVGDTIVAVGYNNRRRHPAQHSVMTAIDNVARSQGGGSWGKPICLERECSHPGVPHAIWDRIRMKYPGVKFGSSAVDRENDSVPYLCTGYSVYTVNEPCVMCSMALVHARARRIFYALSNPEGGLGGKCALHLSTSLNHHYEVFTGFI